MKKTALALSFILLLLISIVVGMRFVEVSKANFVPQAGIHITFPTNTTYNSNTLILDYSADFSFTEHKLITYSLDGKANITILSNQSTPQEMETINGNVILPELSDGSHHLEAYAESAISGYAQVYFTIDTIAPRVSELSIESKLYNTTEMLLNFTVNETTTWIGYSLDNQANITIVGSTTLTGLSDGSHSLRVYANDTAGNMGSSQTVYFTVSLETQPQPVPFSTALVIASVTVVAIVGIGLLVYLKKRRH